MILQQLTLRNFGLYCGEHLLDLSPGRKRNRAAPIILFGGVNGGGKTTILDAIQLVLYGPRARCSKRGDKSYDDFLRESVHHGVDASEGAAIQLAFRFAAEGEEHLYEVSRSWSATRDRVRERVEVHKDGEPELIPFGIAQLCFFDAEKIRFLAEDETSSEALGLAIKSLLGLDLAERLVADAASLETRLAKKSRKSPDLVEAERLEQLLEAKQNEIEAVYQEKGSVENPRQVAERRLTKAEDHFAKVGGTLWKDVSARVQSEGAATENEIVGKLLETRDQHVLSLLKSEKIGAATVKRVAALLESDRTARTSPAGAENRLMLSDGGRRQLDHLLTRTLSEHSETTDRLLKDLDTGRRELEQVQRSLQATPDEESIREVSDELKEAASEAARLKQQVEQISKQLASLRSEHGEIESVLKRLRRKVVDEEIRTEEEGRVATLLKRTQETMKTYLKVATNRKIDRLSQLVSDSFRYLLRKKTLVQRVLIDPETFAITLVDQQGRLVSKERLSEGEKQIFAISVLWGLSQASARPLPAIIDTPMARLDVAHRNQLVELYFPRASHQVIILSTDTEIERNYFQKLQPQIARAYHLNYDEAKKQTVASEGYFWDAEPVDQHEEISV